MIEAMVEGKLFFHALQLCHGPQGHLGSVLDMWALIEECFVKTLEIF